jgi:hypothetical protein
MKEVAQKDFQVKVGSRPAFMDGILTGFHGRAKPQAAFVLPSASLASQ